MTQDILLMFGGVSAEHEVSIITGLQVLENIDRSLFTPRVIYVDKTGLPFYMPDMERRRDFTDTTRKPITFGVDHLGGFIRLPGLFGKKIHPVSAYLAFHGGSGETGPMQGLLESLSIPYTSSSPESLAITMNKQLTKDICGVPTVPGLCFTSLQIKTNTKLVLQEITAKLGLPVILKPVHLGSSIGISIAKTATQLEKSLLTSAQLDSEILVEKLLTDFVEYNIAVRTVEGKTEVSAIERPKSQDEILSFADKYQRGGKKKTGSQGMAGLNRDLPAKIDPKLKTQIETSANAAFISCRCKGMVRIDFMYSKKLYLTEINPIPGSMAFYLWEASGISFKQQITDLIHQSITDGLTTQKYYFDYATDIVSHFIRQPST